LFPAATGISLETTLERDMARRLFLLLTCALALAAVPAASSVSATVTITATGFVPEGVTINAGDSVTWRNADTTVHQVVFGQAPCTLTIQPGATGLCTFRAGGSFNYRDPSQGGAFRGTVTVTGPRRSVTIESSRRAVTFAGAVTLSGVISSQQDGERVNLFAQACGKTAFTRVGLATTAAGGNWTFAVRPTLNTVYQARWRTTESVTATVNVMPRLRLTRAGRRFTARVTAAEAFTGKVVSFQRYRPILRRWLTIKRVVLRTAATPTAGTVVTSRSFRARVRAGWRLRTFLPQAQAGTCYLAAASNVVRIR
jgi:plastocyanin